MRCGRALAPVLACTAAAALAAAAAGARSAGAADAAAGDGAAAANGVAAAGATWLRLIHARQAWRIGGGDPAIRVAIVDSGVDGEHPDLLGRVVDGVDLGDGDAEPADADGHGTAVAGVVAAVCPRCSLLAVKTAPTRAGGVARPAEAVRWAVAHGARVVNMSNGWPDLPGLRAAVEEAWRRGVVVVAAAGNGDDWEGVYPAYYGKALAVGALSPRDGARYPYSSFGPFVDVAAPAPALSDARGGRGYAGFGGTSAAAAVVSGALGLLFSLRPRLTAEAAVRAVEAAALDVGPPGADDDFGAGRLDLVKLLHGDGGRRLRARCAFPRGGPVQPIVFVSSCGGGFDLYARDPDGRVRRLTRSPAVEAEPAVSPDGSRIAFVRGGYSRGDLWVMRADGVEPRRLTRFAGFVESPSWSPDGRRIVFSAYRRGGADTDLWLVRADGSGLRRLTRVGIGAQPAFSPDGGTIAFSSGRRDGSIWLARADGTVLGQLTRSTGEAGDVDPAFSPDGRTVAFARRDAGSGSVYAVDVAPPHALRRLTSASADARSPAFSADGRTIIFSGRFGGGADLFAVPAAGGAVRRILRTPASEVEVAAAPRPSGGVQERRPATGSTCRRCPRRRGGSARLSRRGARPTS